MHVLLFWHCLSIAVPVTMHCLSVALYNATGSKVALKGRIGNGPLRANRDNMWPLGWIILSFDISLLNLTLNVDMF